MTEEDIQLAHAFCTNNRKNLEKGEQCGCFYCVSVLPAKSIEEWVDENDTALCPLCGIDSILPDKIPYPVKDEQFLKDMRKRWFE